MHMHMHLRMYLYTRVYSYIHVHVLLCFLEWYPKSVGMLAVDLINVACTGIMVAIFLLDHHVLLSFRRCLMHWSLVQGSTSRSSTTTKMMSEMVHVRI